MKKLKTLGIIACTAVIIFTVFAAAACEGSVGPMGPQGIQGDAGDKGDDGADGQNGTNGQNGADGASIVWKGNLSAAPTGAQLNWAYYDTTTGNAYIYYDGTWQILAKDGVSGPQGPKGADGAPGVAGENGAPGADGVSIFWQGSLSEEPEDPELNWAYYNSADGTSYIFDGTDWQILVQDGEIGPQGLQGPKGEDGADGLTPYIGANGNWYIGTTDTGVQARFRPIAADFEIDNLTQEGSSVSAVAITPKPEMSTGAITIYYEGTGDTTYAKSTTLPTATGTYAVTFDVAADTNWNTASGLSAGTLTIFTSMIEMVWVPAGSFQMGKNLGTASGADVMPLHTVTLTGFYMGKYVVTQEQYEAVMGTNPSNFKTAVAGEDDTPGKLPVERVSWYDALVFCNKLSMAEGLSPAYRISGETDPAEWGTVPTSSNATWNAVEVVSGSTGYRLPTEAQWEYAAKGGDPDAANWVGYTYAGSDNPDAVAWYTGNSGSKTHEVGKKTANGLGLHDMSGNVVEWCWDWQGGYSSGVQVDPTGAVSGGARVARGGSWDHSVGGVRSAYRYSYDPHYWYTFLGFRLVRP